MNLESIKGLTTKEVNKRRALGLANSNIDSYSPSLAIIIRRNTFNIINTVLVPLIIALAYFEQWRETLVFGVFAVVNSVLTAMDEIRIKRRLDLLKQEFQNTAVVIRDGIEQTIPVSDIVKGDFVKAKEGEGILADGKVIAENYLQLDESMLTGESNYIRKIKDEEVLSGSFIVTGECIYVVESVGKDNYLNRLGAEATRYARGRSSIQKAGDSFTIFFIISALAIGFSNFLVTKDYGFSVEDRLLALTTIMALIIPQTLIFLYTLSFTISVTKLSAKGILIQKGGAIDDLATINVVCMDKTGTITTNDMKLNSSRYWNLTEEKIGNFYTSVVDKILGKNKTQDVITHTFDSFKALQVNDFEQVPFTSKLKYSLIQGEVGKRYIRVTFGAPSVLIPHVKKELRLKVQSYIEEQEDKGFRTLLGLYTEHNKKPKLDKHFESNSIVVFSIEETLNPGIKSVIDKLKEQDIAIKIISGDNLKSVSKIAQKIGIPVENIVDISQSNISTPELALEKTVFTRAKPEDKLDIIRSLQRQGYKVAMIGDGVNDVLAMKLSDVGISMETGSKITRDIADIVLLGNDYKKIPDIFFEGNNIIFNLKIATKIYFAKAIFTIILGGAFTIIFKKPLMIFPSSTLVFSFVGNSLPSYALSVTRQNVQNKIPFVKEILTSSIPPGILFGILSIYVYAVTELEKYNKVQTNTTLIMALLSFSLIYTYYLMWEAKKIKSIKVIGVVFFLSMATGIYQTLAPVTNYSNKLIWVGFFVALITFASILNYFIRSATKNPKTRRLGLLLFLPGIPAAMFFPFNDYYAIVRVPIYIYLHIAIATLIGTLIMLLAQKATKRLLKLSY